MKSFISDLIETDEHATVSSRMSRMLGHKNIRNINKEESIVRNVMPMQKPKAIISPKCDPKVLEYSYPADDLQKKLVQFIQPIVSDFKNKDKDLVRKGEEATSRIMQNKHCANICLLLSKIHKCTEEVTLTTVPKLYLNFCMNASCYDTLFSYYRSQQRLCKSCSNDKYASNRKRKRRKIRTSIEQMLKAE